jgi:hypothetical protein
VVGADEMKPGYAPEMVTFDVVPKLALRGSRCHEEKVGRDLLVVAGSGRLADRQSGARPQAIAMGIRRIQPRMRVQTSCDRERCDAPSEIAAGLHAFETRLQGTANIKNNLTAFKPHQALLS